MNTGKTVNARERASLRHVLPIVALGGSLAAAPAGALELGELTVESNLGQPLRASIAYALAPNEMLSDTCVSVSAGRSTSGLPGIGPSTVSITERAIVITGDAAIREPMLGARVTINCPYTPNLSREYMMFVDPVGAVVAQPAAAPLPAARPQDEPQASPAPASAARTPAADTPIGQSTRYQVKPGDTLSDIVRRIENRSMALWPAVNTIFAANPDAFIDNDPNKLKAGSWLTIPSLDGTAPVVSAAQAASPAAAAPSDAASDTQASPETATAVESVATYEPAEFDEPAAAPQETAASTDSTADLKPGDVVLDGMLPAPTETIDIPDTELEGPQTTSASPNVPTAIISTGSRSESTSTLMWLVGGGLAAIVALLLFGRRVRSRLGSAPVGPAAAERGSREADAAADTAAVADYDIDDDSPTEENLALDADLEIGTGLQEGVEVDVAQDFGFAATTDLDIELPFEPEAPVTDSDTDLIPPVTSNVESILESEVLPEDDDYDMSIIVDATKMPQPEDVTERDLQAVEVGSLDDDEAEDGFTINQESGYSLLEQDYEEELTATQALNQEIERAAAELARDLNERVDDEQTAVLPENGTATETEEATAEMPARDKEATAEFEAAYDPNDTNAVTVNMTGDDKTAEMPVANDDETVEMDVESGKVDSSKG